MTVNSSRSKEESQLIRHTAMTKLNLDDLASSIVGCFPTLDLLEQRLSLALYRLLAEGRAVPRARLAEELEIAVEAASRILDGWPGVFSDARQQVVSYWGLALPDAYASPHRFTVGGRTLSAWCAWDTLFLPQLVGSTAEVESAAPGGGTVRLTVTPERVEHVEPVGAQMSFIIPDCAGVEKDVVTSFCHFVHFFPSLRIGENWAARHAGTIMLPVPEAHVLARLKNEAQYREILR